MKGKIVLDVEGEVRFLCFPLALLSINVLRCKPKVLLAAARFNPAVGVSLMTRGMQFPSPIAVPGLQFCKINGSSRCTDSWGRRTKVAAEMRKGWSPAASGGWWLVPSVAGTSG